MKGFNVIVYAIMNNNRHHAIAIGEVEENVDSAALLHHCAYYGKREINNWMRGHPDGMVNGKKARSFHWSLVEVQTTNTFDSKTDLEAG